MYFLERNSIPDTRTMNRKNLCLNLLDNILYIVPTINHMLCNEPDTDICFDPSKRTETGPKYGTFEKYARGFSVLKWGQILVNYDYVL